MGRGFFHHLSVTAEVTFSYETTAAFSTPLQSFLCVGGLPTAFFDLTAPPKLLFGLLSMSRHNGVSCTVIPRIFQTSTQ